MVDYIGFTRTEGVVWVCRRFEYSHFWYHFGVSFLTCSRFDHRPLKLLSWHQNTTVSVLRGSDKNPRFSVLVWFPSQHYDSVQCHDVSSSNKGEHGNKRNSVASTCYAAKDDD